MTVLLLCGLGRPRQIDNPAAYGFSEEGGEDCAKVRGRTSLKSHLGMDRSNHLRKENTNTTPPILLFRVKTAILLSRLREKGGSERHLTQKKKRNGEARALQLSSLKTSSPQVPVEKHRTQQRYKRLGLNERKKIKMWGGHLKFYLLGSRDGPVLQVQWAQTGGC